MEIHGFNITPQNGSAGTDIPISISVTSDNEGLDVVVDVIATCGDKADTLTLTHKGKRQPIGLASGGIFRVANGGRFGVLKGVEKALVYISNSTLISNGTLLRNF